MAKKSSVPYFFWESRLVAGSYFIYALPQPYHAGLLFTLQTNSLPVPFFKAINKARPISAKIYAHLDSLYM